MLQSSGANCNTETEERDGDCISYEIIAVHPQTRKKLQQQEEMPYQFKKHWN